MSKQKKFEDNLAELETIVQSLENGEIALEDAITAFQKVATPVETTIRTDATGKNQCDDDGKERICI
mgnify:CR=1 FL=1